MVTVGGLIHFFTCVLSILNDIGLLEKVLCKLCFHF